MKQIIEATYDYTNILKKGKIYVNFLILRKAFYVIIHYCIAIKLHMFGTNGKALNCINNFLKNRSQEIVNVSKSKRVSNTNIGCA